MKKKSASQSAFFNLRVLIGLFIVMAGVFLALAGFGTFSALTASRAQAQQTYKIIDIPGLPPGFDCSTIHELGIDRMENLRAGLIMIACGEGGSASTSPLAAVNQAIEKVLAPLTYGGADVDLVTGTETPPHIIQSETYTNANPDNPLQVVAAFNDSRGAASSNFSGVSVSADGGSTFTRVTNAIGQSPFANTFGDPVILYNKPTATWFTVWIDGGCGGGGMGGYKSTNPSDPASWTHYCVHTGGSDDRESGWADNNTASPHYGNMYVSRNDFAVGGGALFVSVSTDNGLTWTQHQITSGSPFIRDVQITGDEATGDLYIAGMNEGGGGTGGLRSNLIFRSTDGGTTWTNTYTGPTFTGPSDGTTCFSNSYFAAMFSGYWRHMGWGEPAAINHVVHYVYAQHGSGSDPSDVYYIRSTDSGVTFSAPLKLNTDSTTRPQWQPNLSVSPSGTVFAVWYDARESTTCTRGNPTVPCYRMWARKSTDNGVTWLPDDMFSDVVTPLPTQNDPNIVGCYAGDYDYGSAIAAKHVSSWVDGRVAIGGSSQQDAFTDRELVGAGGNPVPVLTSLSPSSKTVGSPGFTLTVNGSNFVPGASVSWNNSARSTTFVSSVKVTAQILTTDLATAGTVPVIVTNPGPGGGPSNSLTFTINNPRPMVTSISPTSATAGGPGFTLTVNGSGFITSSVVNWNGAARTTTFSSSHQLTAAISAADIATAGTNHVTVTNPGPGGGTSAPKTFTVNNPVPAISSISPSSATAGGPGFTLTVNGSNFVAGSKVHWNSSVLTTTFVSSIQVTAAVPALDIRTAGTASVTVVNATPGGGTSNAETFTINP
jgi:hypothetical protein